MLRYSALKWSFFGCVAVLTACHGRIVKNADLKVTNGVLDLGDRGVFLILAETPSTGESFTCTASLIRPDIILTAAHCIKDRRTAEMRSMRVATSSAASMKSFRIHPEYKASTRYDVAVIKLDRAIEGAPLVPLAAKNPTKGAHARLVGFGGNQYGDERGVTSGSGVKRTGYAKITEIDDHFIYSRGIRDASPAGTNRPNGQDSAVVSGDSGGPLLDGDGAIIGIGKAGNSTAEAAVDKSRPPVISAHTQVAVVRDFIDRALADLEK